MLDFRSGKNSGCGVVGGGGGEKKGMQSRFGSTSGSDRGTAEL